MILKEKLDLLKIRYASDDEALHMLSAFEAVNEYLTELKLLQNASILKATHIQDVLEKVDHRLQRLEAFVGQAPERHGA
jgi:ribulose 1,5-bisphosphate synthetase/thiazole synthase